MRLLTYLSLSNNDKNTNIFRSVNLKLVSKPSDYTPIVSEVCKKFLVSEKDILSLKEDLNKELKKTYQGKCFFDFCLDEGLSLEKIKIPKKNHDRLTLKLFTANDYLENIKKKIERKLQTSE